MCSIKCWGDGVQSRTTSKALHPYDCHPLATPIAWPTFLNSKRKEMPPSTPCQHGHIVFYCPHTSCCPNCCFPLSRASEAAAQHDKEVERKRAAKEKQMQEEARLEREALELVRLEQDLLRQRARICHEQRLYEENKKRWLMKLETF